MSSSSDNSESWTTNYNYNVKGFGIPHKRSCTDIYCLFVFAVFILCWIGIGYYAYRNGDITTVTVPQDSMGRLCGIDEGVKDTPYLLFYDISKCASLSSFIFGCPTKQICVKDCPKNNWFSENEKSKNNGTIDFEMIRRIIICNDTFTAKTIAYKEQLFQLIEEQKCAPMVIHSRPFSRLCLPDLLETKQVEVEEVKERAQNYFSAMYKLSAEIQEDFTKCWHFIALFVTISLISSLFVIIVLGIITKIVIQVILGTILIILFYSSVVTFMQYQSMSDDTPDQNHTDFLTKTIYGRIQTLFQHKTTWFVLFIVSVSFFAIFSLLILFLRSRIELAVLLIGEGSKAVNSIKSALLMPLGIRFLQISIIVWFFMVFGCVKAVGNSLHTVKIYNKSAMFQCNEPCRSLQDGDMCVPSLFNSNCGSCSSAKCEFKEYIDSSLKSYLHFYNFFGLLWSLYFVSGLGRMILSFCFSMWYWTREKSDLPFFTLFYSLFYSFRYHLGTVALGSFLIATCGFIRYILEHMQRILKQSDGLITQFILWGMRSCFWCLEKFLIFISYNAYIMCAIMGTNFFTAATEAAGLLARNIIRVVVLDNVLDFIILVAKLSISVFWGMISFLAFRKESLNLHYPGVLAVFVAVASWIIATSFFNVYEVAVDTLFLSFLRDTEINDGTQTKPYYMSQKLKYMLKETDRPKRKKNRNK